MCPVGLDQYIAQHLDELTHVDYFAINLSGQTLTDKKLLRHILRHLGEGGVPPSKIRFEVTETAAIANLRFANEFIQEIRKIGSSVALDDFGSGLSSFAYLKNLHVDALKIDGVFVRDILDDPIDLAMVKSINDIGHVMGLTTIAEFVENDAIAKQLLDMGVDYIQGYGVGVPVSLDEVLSKKPLLSMPQ